MVRQGSLVRLHAHLCSVSIDFEYFDIAAVMYMMDFVLVLTLIMVFFLSDNFAHTTSP